jgi:hypothetical protein
MFIIFIIIIYLFLSRKANNVQTFALENVKQIFIKIIYKRRRYMYVYG